ncbi:anthranilate phosphoribosyltransferase [Beggiatoa alba B18LD]|uniref:Anthranilate phosphoribosyltransferase n=1 Tax=Beggiatoa alba B18LD TaxID=395493 RepID=I3CCP8_9GAMM|nr:glycosyl transferase family protein [Beggiatoa alba]EIJ41391.1 anthranilate phosphoribosyltransferase [Beggiatoa alba B18LD]
MSDTHSELFNHYTEHPFAQYIRALGKGKNGARPLSREESYQAMRMIVAGEVEPVQLGAFMMLMRVKEETREELAGFVQAVRDSFQLPQALTPVDLDWSSYAGKRRHLPWFLLATLLLANNGIKVFMHGAGGHTNGRIYTKDVLHFLGLPYATTFAEAVSQLEQHHFSYFPLEYLCPKLQEIMDLRPLMGLRSPIHTVVRMINPFNAPYMMQGIFHPSFRDVHQEAGQLLNQPHLAVIKGEGGEIERNPDVECLVKTLHDGELGEELWQPLFKQRHIKEMDMNPERLAALWRGDIEDEFAVASITGTVAIALKFMGKANTQEEAQALADTYWANRHKDKYGKNLAMVG